jgi:thymidylate synthase
MQPLDYGTLGETWINLVARTFTTGHLLPDGLRECLGVSVSFPGALQPDAVIERFGDGQMVEQMRRVFFDKGANDLGHSYAALMSGPDGRPDLADVVQLLSAERFTKRAVVTICGKPGGKVPCLNIIQFLVREGTVHASYFARGQDAFKKFYADGLCVAAMAAKVAQGLDLPAGRVRGFLASSHVYAEDTRAIENLLDQGKAYLKPGLPSEN